MQKVTGLVIACGIAALVGKSNAEPVAKPAPAAQLLASAQKRAGKQHKNVLVIFHASWCGWCKRLTSVMEMPEHKKLFTDNYVIVDLDVSENDDQKALENPGADKVMAGLGGAKSGLPFYAVVDSGGKKLADSNMVPGANETMENIGYPAAEKEIAAFDTLLKTTAPKMNVAARQRLITYFNRTSPQRSDANTGH